MANMKDTAATGALNEDKYINKIYDTALGSQSKLLEDTYKNNGQVVNAGQEQNRNLTDAYLDRTRVEAPGVSNGAYGRLMGAGGPAGREAQAGLSFGNQRQKNLSALTQQQNQADAEFERMRQQLADSYSAAIKKAQADNDMERAQKLYEAAKAEEDQLRDLRQQGAELLAGNGDMSGWEGIAEGTPIQRDTEGETWDGVLKNEESINKIYDAMLESQRIAAGAERDRALSELEAARAQAQRETDGKLNELYVNSLKSGRNAMEGQNAYGQSSGLRDQSQMARANQLTGGLTDLRRLGLGADLKNQAQKLDAHRKYGDALYEGMSDVERKRMEALYDAAESEEQALIGEQEGYGKALAEKGDYSVLGKLYGMTEEQIKSLMRSGWSGEDPAAKYPVRGQGKDKDDGDKDKGKKPHGRPGPGGILEKW